MHTLQNRYVMCSCGVHVPYCQLIVPEGSFVKLVLVVGLLLTVSYIPSRIRFSSGAPSNPSCWW